MAVRKQALSLRPKLIYHLDTALRCIPALQVSVAVSYAITPSRICPTAALCLQGSVATFNWSCVEPTVGLNDPCGSLPSQDSL